MRLSNDICSERILNIRNVYPNPVRTRILSIALEFGFRLMFPKRERCQEKSTNLDSRTTGVLHWDSIQPSFLALNMEKL